MCSDAFYRQLVWHVNTEQHQVVRNFFNVNVNEVFDCGEGSCFRGVHKRDTGGIPPPTAPPRAFAVEFLMECAGDAIDEHRVGGC